MSKFNHNANLVIFTTNIDENKQYVLSSNKHQIELPYLSINRDNKKDIDESIGEFIRKEILFLQNEELFIQLISLNEEVISDDPETISSVYGFIIPQQTQVNLEKYHWLKFDLLDGNKYNPIFIDVIRSLV